jgi:hemoglobin
MQVVVKVQSFILFVCLWVAGCGPVGTPSEIGDDSPRTAAGDQTLYDRLGGASAIYAITNSYIDRLMQDPRVNFAREGHAHAWTATPDSVARLKLYWAQYIDRLADGPQVYEGRSLADAHRGMDLSEGEWVATMEDLKLTLDEYRVPPEDQNDLLKRVAATHDVVMSR